MNDQTQPLNVSLANDVLQYLGVEADDPSPDLLDALVAAYIRRVPWESASRIVRRASTRLTADCPRWPEIFWTQAMQAGTGGTCYESNYAFFSLLLRLGFDGYLTVNNMGQSIGCHTAIVVMLGDDERWLVDVGIPLHVPIPLLADMTTTREGPFHTYTIEPAGPHLFQVMRDRHPKPYIFTLIDQPTNNTAYRAVTTADYDEYGLFLDRVIVTRVVDERVWRFSSESPPYQLESFWQGDATYRYLGDSVDAVAQAVADKFRMQEDIVYRALQYTQSP
jgi:arylamine N-acetyltransferase